MTNEEALSELKDIYEDGECEYAETPTRRETIRLAIEALEKQIPKKAIKDGYNNGELVCPMCGREVDTTAHHCKCGQTVEWGAPDCCRDCREYKAFDGFSDCESIEKYGYCSKALGEEGEL